MSKPTVTLTLAGDNDDLKRAFAETDAAADKVARGVEDADRRVAASQRDVGESARRAGTHFEALGERADVAEQRIIGYRDGLTGAQDSLAGFTALAKGEGLEGFILLGMGAGDTASSIANLVGPGMKAAIERLGALRLALLGVAGVAGIAAAGAFYLMVTSVKKMNVDLNHATEDLKRFTETGRATVFVEQRFAANEQAIDSMAKTLHQATEDWKDFWFNQGLHSPTSIGEWAKAGDEVKDLDTALAGFIESGGDAAELQRELAARGYAANLQFALANDLLPQYAAAVERAQQRGWDLADATRAQAEAFFEATKQLDTYASALKAQTDPLFRFVQAQEGVTSAQSALNDAIKEHGRDSEEAQRAQLDLAAAQLALADAAAAVAGVADAQLIPALQQMVEDGQLSAEGFELLKNALIEGKAAADRFNGTRVQVNFFENYVRTYSSNNGLTPNFNGSIRGYATGGEVNNVPIGAPTLAVLHGGEEVISYGDRMRGGGGMTLNLNLGGSALDHVVAEALLRAAREDPSTRERLTVLVNGGTV